MGFNAKKGSAAATLSALTPHRTHSSTTSILVITGPRSGIVLLVPIVPLKCINVRLSNDVAISDLLCGKNAPLLQFGECLFAVNALLV